ncbi:carboxypeptidase-like regulatory domain-containing protein [Microbacterium sp. LTA6]|uniref:MSCRAMM family protein n=1 Tax=Microbacterium sp. LTA6 TaxID=3129771 RepID=UPI00325474FB
MVFTGAVTAVAEDAAATATITGHVTREGDGSPVSGAAVYVSPTAGGFSHNGTTDASGDYSVTGLAPGEYTVRFEAIGTGLITEYWNGVYDWMSAQRIVVGDGETVTGIDASMQLGGSITGQVTRESDGSPVSGVTVQVSSNSPAAPKYAWTGMDGTYRIFGILPGDYTVRFTPPADSGLGSEAWNGVLDGGAATPVTVVAGDVIEAIDASLVAMATISGHVTRESDGSPVPGFVDVLPVGSVGGPSAAIGADGSYSIGVSPGTYIVRFRPLDEGLFSEFWEDARFQEDATSITVAAGDRRTEIDGQLSSSTAITGTVRADGDAVADVAVTAYDGDQLAGNAYTNSDGEYSLTLPAGDYTVVARAPFYNPIHATQYYESAATRDEATPVKLGADADRTGVDFDLVPGNDIRGTVVATGEDLSQGEGAAVIAYRAGSDGWQEIARVPSWGDFSFSPNRAVDGGPLPAGTYTIGVELPGFCTQYYGGAATLEEAEAFDLTEGETFTAADVVLTVDCPAPKPTLTLSATSVKAGGDITVTGENFAPGEKVAFELHSDPISLGELVASENGTLSGTFRIPSTVPAGAHHIVALGEESAVEVSIAIEVTAVAGGGGTGTVGGAGTGSGLANTGASVPVTAALAGLFLAALGAFFLRRRRSAR